MKHDKLMKTARILDRIAKIVSGFMGAFVIMMIILAVLVLIFGEKMFVAGSLKLELGHVKLYMAEQYQGVTEAIQAFVIIALAAGSVLCAVTRLILGRLRSILAPMKEGRPFEQHIPADLRRIAWLTLLNGFLTQVISLAERVCFAKAFPLEQIITSEAVTKIEYVQSFDLGFVWLFLVILFLSYIFSYGQMLQQEADETL